MKRVHLFCLDDMGSRFIFFSLSIFRFTSTRLDVFTDKNTIRVEFNWFYESIFAQVFVKPMLNA